ncbi:ubiquitin-specific protease ubp14 [Sarracenia purpurea var. burkii]
MDGGDIEKATDWIFSPNVSGSSDMDISSSSTSIVDSQLPDGGGGYRLIGIVSHIGTSTHCGHYVAHVYKDVKQSPKRPPGIPLTFDLGRIKKSPSTLLLQPVHCGKFYSPICCLALHHWIQAQYQKK